MLSNFKIALQGFCNQILKLPFRASVCYQILKLPFRASVGYQIEISTKVSGIISVVKVKLVAIVVVIVVVQ